MPTKQILHLVEDKNGTVVAITIPKEDVDVIRRYDFDPSPADIKRFVQETVNSTVSWMRRLLKGGGEYKLNNLEHWYFDRKNELLKLVDHNKDAPLEINIEFTQGTIEDYNLGLAEILNTFWYHAYAYPTAVVELIAAADLLYREHHDGMPPALAQSIDP